MGRPLNDRFFGNRNIGSVSTTTDNGIGGQGIASINWSEYGSVMATAGVPLAGLALPAPTLPGGVQAAWTLVYGVADVTTGAGKAGLVQGDTYTYPVIPGSRVVVASVSGSNATFNVTVAGTTSSLVTDSQTVNLNLVTGSGTSTFVVDVFQKVVSSVINENGSGYAGSESFTVTLDNGAAGTVPAGTLVLTTNSGIQNPSQNPAGENAPAIVIHANVGGEGGTLVGDIQKQVGTRRYRVKTSDGVGRVNLVASDSPNAGEAYIVATDSGSATYWVTKLTAHRVTLVPRTGSPQFPLVADGLGGYESVSAGWVLSGATANKTVVIENA